MMILNGCGGKVFPQTNASVTGVVKFPAGLNMATDPSLKKAVVYLDNSRSVVTDANGNFSFDNIAVGKHTLKVSDYYFESQEISVDYNGEELTGIELNAEIAAVIVNAIAKQRSIKVNLTSNDFLGTAGELVKFKLAYDNGAGFVSVETGDPSYNSYSEPEITEICNLDQELKLQVSVLDAASQVERVFVKKIRVPKFEGISPVNNEMLNTDKPTFTWTKLVDASIKYDFRLKNQDPKKNINIESLLIPRYTLTNALIPSQKFIWFAEANLSDPAGHRYMHLQTDNYMLQYQGN